MMSPEAVLTELRRLRSNQNTLARVLRSMLDAQDQGGLSATARSNLLVALDSVETSNISKGI